MASKKAKREKRKIQYTNAKVQAQSHTSGWTPTAVKLPEGLSFFQPKEAKTYRLNILPYEVKKGKDEPGGNPNADSGFLHYERTYWAHRGIGTDQNTYCCLQRTFGKKCPICRDLTKMRRSAKADPDLIKDLEARERQVFQVIDLGNVDKGIQLWDVSYHLFGKMLDNKIKASEDDDDYENFYHLDGGSVVRVTLGEKQFAGRTFLETTMIEMKARKEPLEESILDEVADLDECLVETPYEELKAIYLQDDDEEEEASAKKGGKKAKPKDDDEEEDEDEDEEEEDSDEDDDEDDDDEEEEEEVKPKKKAPAKKAPPKKGPAKKKPADDDDDDDDDEEEDDDDEEEDEDDDSDSSDEDDDDADESDDDDDDDDDEEEEEEEVKPKRGRPRKK